MLAGCSISETGGAAEGAEGPEGKDGARLSGGMGA